MNRKSAHTGFTIIELIISLAIFAAMTALVIAKYGSFNQGTLITNMAYDMALTVRTAQTYGLSVKSTDPTVDNFGSAYGVHFAGNDITHFTFFADTVNGIGSAFKYDGTAEDITKYTITQGAQITAICLGALLSDCATNANGAYKLIGTDSLDITYKRPNPNAYFYVTNASNVTTAYTQPIAFITLSSSDNTNNQVVYVRKNGQISVGN
ncbi:MAG: prepilin-type N-terminal cleavage/methylation domain-containing protein [Candidatus Pacebacteria bacterium]|nr:prepilin-type N-terminal cleavage/methylation domain-containing protein [Candidatus Paceibacterota bacterium]